ncbi:LysR family transcriptional regulator [Roseburia hominis]
MNFHNLQCVLEIWKCGSINKAAKNLFTSQSNLSHSIRALETELGFPLFARSSKGIELTQEGELFIQSAQIILSEHNKIKKIPSQFKHHENISISCTNSALFMQTFIQFLNQSPAIGCRDSFKETGLIQVIQDVVEQRYRMAIFYCFEDREPFHRLTANRYHMDLVPLRLHIPLEVLLSTSHPLAQLDSVSYQDLPNQNIVTYENFDPADWLEVLGLNDEEKITYIFDRGGLFDTVKTGQYISVVVKNSISIPEGSKVTTLPLDFDKYIGIYLMKSQSYQVSVREKKFIHYLKNQLKI